MTFKEKFQLLLKNEGLKMREFAEQIDINYSQVSNYVNGHKRINYEFIEKLVERIPSVDLNWLLRDNDEETDIVRETGSRYSRPDTAESLIAEITSKLEKLKQIVSQK